VGIFDSKLNEYELVLIVKNYEGKMLTKIGLSLCRQLSAWSICALLLSTQVFASMEELIGQWKSPNIPIGQGIGNIKISFDFKADRTCNFRIEYVLNHPAGNRGERNDYNCEFSLPAANKIDYKFKRSFVTMTDVESVKEANKKKTCGFNDWKLGIPKDVTGANCDQGSFGDNGELKDIYELANDGQWIYFGMDILPKPVDDDSEVPTDEEGRPTQVFKAAGFGKNGVSPPPLELPEIHPDTLSGLYSVVDYRLNSKSCDQAPAPTADAPKFIRFYAGDIVIPGLEGWMAKECKSEQQCSIPAGWDFNAKWFISRLVEPDHRWLGDQIRSSLVGDVCHYEKQMINLTRISSRSLEINAKRYSATLPVDQNGSEKCSTRRPELDQLFKSAPCIGFDHVELQTK
jgi:hypothetical protein